MFYLNKLVGAFTDPLMAGVLLVLAGFALMACRRRRTGLGVGLAGVVVLWVLGSGWTAETLGCHLERMYPPTAVETLPQADAIVLLGGGTSAIPEVSPYAELHEAADRVWHAARLYRAGKAPLVVPTGSGEELSAVPLLVDLGVPREAIRVENAARNTEENAKFVQGLLLSQSNNQAVEQSNNRKPKVLLVTSSYHMRRSLLMYRRYAPGLEIVPAAIDYQATLARAAPTLGNIPEVYPDANALMLSKQSLKELIGYWGYRLLRR